MPEYRRDPVTGDWVIIAPDRIRRPGSFQKRKNRNNSVECPFCPGNEKLTPKAVSIVGKPNAWEMRVIPNKFPGLIVSDKKCTGVKNTLLESLPGFGFHEVIIETNDHKESYYSFTKSKIAGIFRLYQSRILAIQKNENISYCQLFKNYGILAGATQSHSHAQIIATSTVPEKIEQELSNRKDYYHKNGNCLTCAILHLELQKNERIVYNNDCCIAIAPYASKFPYQVKLVPKRHENRFEMLEGSELDKLAEATVMVFKKIKSKLGKVDFNLYFDTSPQTVDSKKWFHFTVNIIPRAGYVAGFELASGMYINSVSPETAARELGN